MANGLYGIDDLMAGFDPVDPQSFVKTFDFKTYLGFVAGGAEVPHDPGEELRQAEHDVGIGRALRDFLTPFGSDPKIPRLVGVMGGHSVRRDARAYLLMSDVARELTRRGFLIVSGGGPGLMEAAHFGACFGNSDDAAYLSAQADLADASTAGAPAALNVKSGVLVPGQEGAIEKVADWYLTALKAKDHLKGAPAPNLAIPTWRYGSEPTIPFATGYAKFYQNSIREEALVIDGRAGVIFGRGGGGTIREVFQDVEHNFYAATPAAFSPMIFVDPDGFYLRDTVLSHSGTLLQEGVNLKPILSVIMDFAFATKPAMRSTFADKILFSTDVGEIAALLESYAPSAQIRLRQMLSGAQSESIEPEYLHPRA